ncbi:MAG TPA: hypothetical protein PK156_44190 [Polyangium sp.]|nr:hypothetical protein [Polyangium sp.]
MRKLEYGLQSLGASARWMICFVVFGCLGFACATGASSLVSTGDAGQGGSGGDSTANAGQGGFGGEDGVLSSSSGSTLSCNDWCGWDTYCDAPPDNCPNNLLPGTCTLRPNDCTGEPMQPVCACNGQVYKNPCEAHAAGVDVGWQKDCNPPVIFYFCGPVLCAEGTTFCESINGYHQCKPLPDLCKTTGSMCDCLDGVRCTSAPGPQPMECVKDANGHFVVTCVVTE